MTINLKMPDITELKPRITVFGVGGAGGNAVNNMITSNLEGVDFVVANTDAQALKASQAERVIQMGIAATEGLGAGSHPEVGAGRGRGGHGRDQGSPPGDPHGLRDGGHGRRHRGPARRRSSRAPRAKWAS